VLYAGWPISAPFVLVSSCWRLSQKKGYRPSACTLQKYLPHPFSSLAQVLYVVPLGIMRGVLRPFTIAWKICARLEKFAFAGESAGHPPELSE